MWRYYSSDIKIECFKIIIGFYFVLLFKMTWWYTLLFWGRVCILFSVVLMPVTLKGSIQSNVFASCWKETASYKHDKWRKHQPDEPSETFITIRVDVAHSLTRIWMFQSFPSCIAYFDPLLSKRWESLWTPNT